MGIPVSRIELVNALQMRAIENYSKLGYPESPCSFFEFRGSDANVAEQAESFGKIVTEYGDGLFLWTTIAEEWVKLWKARHDAYWGLSMDDCVPSSKLTECIAETEVNIVRLGLIATIVGHASDGSFYTLVLMDPNDPAFTDRAEEFVKRLGERAIVMGGTSTGEHGIC